MDFKQGYVIYFFVLSNILLTAFFLSAASFIIHPLIAAFIVAILLNPIYKTLTRIGLPRILNAVLSILILLIGIIVLLSFITTQLGNITSELSLPSQSLAGVQYSTQKWIVKLLPADFQNQSPVFQAYLNNGIKKLISYLPNVLSATTTYGSMFLLFFLSVFFFLYYNTFFLSFLYKIFGKENKARVIKTIYDIENSVKNYIVGLFIAITLIAILNSIGLLILNIPHAIFFGMLGALLTIIPYVGILIGSLIPVAYTLLSTDSFWTPVGIIFVFSFVQFLEGNFITPNVVGSKVNINPYMAIFGLFVGGLLLGAIGVIFAIPLLGIIKIICDEIDSLKPIGYVMGNPNHSFQTSILRAKISKMFRWKGAQKKNK